MVLYSLVIKSPYFFAVAKVYVFFIPSKFFSGKMIKIPTFIEKMTFLPLFMPFLCVIFLAFFHEWNAYCLLILQQIVGALGLKVCNFLSFF